MAIWFKQVSNPGFSPLSIKYEYICITGADIELGASSPLMEAATEGHVDLVRFLLEKGEASFYQIFISVLFASLAPNQLVLLFSGPFVPRK